MKTCGRCKQSKVLEAFAKRAAAKDGRQPMCRACNTITRTEWARNNKDRVAIHTRKSKYGITESEYQAMITSQGNKCAVCRETFSRSPHVDHNHKTGQVRGLLCNRCNTFVGFLETKDVLDEARKYLADAALA